MQEHRYGSYESLPISHAIPLVLGCFSGGLLASAAFWVFVLSLPTSCEVNSGFVRCILVSPVGQVEALIIFIAATFLSFFAMYRFRKRFRIGYGLISFLAGGFLGGAVVIVTAFVLFFSS